MFMNYRPFRVKIAYKHFSPKHFFYVPTFAPLMLKMFTKKNPAIERKRPRGSDRAEAYALNLTVWGKDHKLSLLGLQYFKLQISHCKFECR